MQYLISKKTNSAFVYINCDKMTGYTVNPRNRLAYGISVNQMVIVKRSFIEKLLKRKIKVKLDYYLKLIIDGMDGNDDDDSHKALDDIQRYRCFVREKYASFLEDRYLEMLEKKLTILERELKSIYIYATISKDEKALDKKDAQPEVGEVRKSR